MRVKWICRATSLTSSSSAARTHRTTLSGSLWEREREALLVYELMHVHVAWVASTQGQLVANFRTATLHLHIERLGSLVDADCNASLWQRRGEDFLQSLGHRVHSATQFDFNKRCNSSFNTHANTRKTSHRTPSG